MGRGGPAGPAGGGGVPVGLRGRRTEAADGVIAVPGLPSGEPI